MADPSSRGILIGRIVLVFTGICCFVMMGGGIFETYTAQKHGFKTQGKVLEIVLDHHYRTTNYRRNEEFYKVNVEFTGEQRIQGTRWVHISPSEKKAMRLELGSRVPLVYVPTIDETMIASEIPSLNDIVIPGAAAFSLGILFVVWAFSLKPKP